MKRLFYFIILFLFLCVPIQAFGYTELHYVTQGGAGSKTGRSLANAWALSNFHNTSNWSTSNAADSKIGPDDVVYLSGNFTDRVYVTRGGSSSGSITLDGYAAGECNPLNAVCTGSADLKKGLEVGDSSVAPDYLTIQDFRMTRNETKSDSCLRLYSSAGDIDRIIVRRNYIYQTNGNMFYYYGGKNSVIEDNKFVHFGQNNIDATQGVNFIDVRNSLISSNEFGHDEDLYPSGCTSANIIEVHGCHYLLFEYNNIYGAPNGGNLVPKEAYGGNTNIVIRFNKVHKSLGRPTGSGGIGVYFRTSEDEENINFYVYGNLVYNNYNGIALGDVMNTLYIWSNIIHSSLRTGMFTWRFNIDGMHIYNNTIAYNNTLGDTDLTRGGISLSAYNSTYYIKNNILWNNHPGGEANRKQIYAGVTINSLEHNTYYHSSGTPYVYYSGGYRTIQTLQSTYGFENDSPVGAIRDSVFVDPNGADNVYGTSDDNYKLQSTSPERGSGATLSGSFSVNLSGGDSWFEAQTGYSTLSFGLDDGLDPNLTDWTTNPPTVVTTKQGDHGVGWERGAYVYPEGEEEDLIKPGIIFMMELEQDDKNLLSWRR